MKENIQQAVHILRAAKADLVPLLEGAPNLSIRSNSALDGLINFFSHTGGLAPEIQTTADIFPPITEFMGEKIETAKEIQPQDLEVGISEKAIYKAKVKALYEELPNLANEDILKNGSIDHRVLRGVAKLAGLIDYQDAELTYPFLDEIKAGIAAKGEVDAALAASKNKGRSKVKDEANKLEAPKSSTTEIISPEIPQDLLIANGLTNGGDLKLNDENTGK